MSSDSHELSKPDEIMQEVIIQLCSSFVEAIKGVDLGELVMLPFSASQVWQIQPSWFG